jgi:general secretion pathway protein G
VLKPRTKAERRIFFPWEGRGGLRRFLAKGRFGPLLVVAMIVAIVSWMFARERTRSGIRRTHVVLAKARPQVERYLLEHDGKCPESLDEVLSYLSIPEAPRDAWGRPLRLVCPSVRPEVPYVLMSDGPDGKPGGLDRIEY